MSPDNAKFFYEISKNSWGDQSLDALVEEETSSLFQNLLNAVEHENFHEATLIRGRIQAWESLKSAIDQRAKQYKPPRVESAA